MRHEVRRLLTSHHPAITNPNNLLTRQYLYRECIRYSTSRGQPLGVRCPSTAARSEAVGKDRASWLDDNDFREKPVRCIKDSWLNATDLLSKPIIRNAELKIAELQNVASQDEKPYRNPGSIAQVAPEPPEYNLATTVASLLDSGPLRGDMTHIVYPIMREPHDGISQDEPPPDHSEPDVVQWNPSRPPGYSIYRTLEAVMEATSRRKRKAELTARLTKEPHTQTLQDSSDSKEPIVIQRPLPEYPEYNIFNALGSLVEKPSPKERKPEVVEPATAQLSRKMFFERSRHVKKAAPAKDRYANATQDYNLFETVGMLVDTRPSQIFAKANVDPMAKWQSTKPEIQHPSPPAPALEIPAFGERSEYNILEVAGSIMGIKLVDVEDNPEPVVSVGKELDKARKDRMSKEDTDAWAHKHIASYEDFVAQAKVENPNTLGMLLVDKTILKHNYHFWLRILQFRARVDKSEGIRAVWRGMSIRNVDLPVRGDAADELWATFIRLGVDDMNFLEEIWSYANELYARKKGRKWRKLYEAIVGGLMEKDPEGALQWHSRLTPSFWAKDSGAFFRRHSKAPNNLPTLWQIYQLVKADHLYTIIIPHLCLMGRYKSATRWHKLLLDRQDLPPDTSTFDDLLRYLVHNERLVVIRTLLLDLRTAGVPWSKSTLMALISPRSRFWEMLTLLKDPILGIKSTLLDDSFWALVVSFQHIETSRIDSLMIHFEIKTLGGKTAEEFVKRQRERGDFIAGVRYLNARNYPVGDQLQSRALRIAVSAKEEKVKDEALDLLTNIPITEQNAKEALLKAYLLNGNWEKFYHVYSNLSLQTTMTWNLLAQSYLARNMIAATMETLEDMRVQSVHPNKATIAHILGRLLQTRRDARGPAPQFPNLRMAMKVLQQIVLSGGYVQTKVWHEILKRFGMGGHHDYLERLCFWLVDHYSPTTIKVEARKLTLPGNLNDAGEIIPQFGSEAAHEAAGAQSEMTDRSKNNRLRQLFVPNFVKAVIDWGFMDLRNHKWSAAYLTGEADIPPPPTSSLAYRFAWGLYFLRALLAVGVPIDTKSVRRAVRLRMRAIYGPRASFRLAARRMSSRYKAVPPSTMVRTIEETWGSRIFRKQELDSPDVLSKFVGRHKRITPSAMQRRARLRAFTLSQKRVRRRTTSRNRFL